MYTNLIFFLWKNANFILTLLLIGFICILHFAPRNFVFKFLYIIYLISGLFLWSNGRWNNYITNISILYLILINIYLVIKGRLAELVPLLLILCSVGLLWSDLLTPNKDSSLIMSVPGLTSLLKSTLEIWILTFMEEWIYQFLFLVNLLIIIVDGLSVYLLGLLGYNLRIKFGINHTYLSRVQDGILAFLYLRFSIIYIGYMVNESHIGLIMKFNIWLLAVAGIYWLVQDFNKDVDAV